MDNDTASIVKMLAASVLRHGLTIAAGWLLSKGILTTNNQSQFIDLASSMGLVILGLGWSAIQKFGHDAQVKGLLKAMADMMHEQSLSQKKG